MHGEEGKGYLFMDLHMLSSLEPVFLNLHTPVSLLDSEGNSLIPNEDIRFVLPKLTDGAAVVMDGRTYKECRCAPNLVMMIPALSGELTDDLFRMADAMIGAALTANTASNDVGNAYQRLLQNELSLAELDAVVEEYHIQRELPRCVLLMHMVQVNQRSAQEILEEVLPKMSGDVIVTMDKHTAAFLKDCSGVEDEDELRQFALAAQETLRDETALNLTVGIGCIAKSIEDLHSSFRQARRAIEIGRVYREDETVFVYRSLLLERFLSDIQPDTAAHYHSLLFNRSTARLFSDEMLYTIEMFFKKDLNLSDTARQLYIHRNTLVYRLDKVQRQVGLDLRKFSDAVTFKMLLEMKKCGNNKAKASKKLR